MDIPVEIRNFLNQGGKTLLILGKPGTGKTLFALTILRIFRKAGRQTFYVSTRIDADTLYSDVPWLAQILAKENIVDAAITKYSQASYPGREVKEDEHTLVKKGLIYRDTFTFLRGLKDLGRRGDIIVIDSFEAVKNHIDLALFDLCDFARRAGINLVLVSERPSFEEAEYHADGIVELSMDFVDGRMVREAKIQKLRGTPINKYKYCFTLKDASFRLSYLAPGSSKLRLKWETIPNPKDHYSTGIKDLDEILEGGYRRGSIVLLEFSGDLPIFNRSIFLSTMLNFSFQWGHVFAIPPIDTSPKRLMRILTKYIDNETFLKTFTVFGRKEALDPWVKLLDCGSAYEFTRKMKEIEKSVIAKSVPIMRFVGLGNLEYMWGSEGVIEFIHRYVPEVKSKNDLMILAGYSHLKSIEACASIANAHLKLTSKNDCQIMYGIKPRTIPYGIESKEGEFRLIPML